MRKSKIMLCLALLLVTAASSFAQIVPDELISSGYYYIVSAYDQIPEGEQYALATTDNYGLTMKQLNLDSNAQIWYIEKTDNGSGSPRFRLYACDKVNGIQGTTNNNAEEITTIESISDIPAMTSMRQGTYGYTIAVNNRTGKLITPSKVEDGASVWMTGGQDNLNNENTTCHEWHFIAISEEKFEAIDPEGFLTYKTEYLGAIWDALAALGRDAGDAFTQAYVMTGNDGGLPGFYTSDQAQRYNDLMVWANCPHDIGGYSLYKEIEAGNTELVAEISAKIMALYEELKEGPAKVTDGYYYLVSAFDELNALGTDPDAPCTEYAAYAMDESIGWADLDRENTKMIWKFEQREDGMWDVTNFQNGKYPTRSPSNGRLATLSAEQDYPIGIKYGAGEGRIEMNSNNDSGWKYYCRLNPDQPQLECGNRNNYFTNETGRYWYFYPISAAFIEEMQEKVLHELQAYAYAEALQDSIMHAKTRVLAAYVRDMTNAVDVTPLSSDDFDSNAAQSADHGLSYDAEKGQCLYGTEGGGFAALIDDQNSTFFHTTSSQEVVEYVYDENDNVTTVAGLPSLMMKLSEPVDNVSFAFYRRESTSDWSTPNTIDVSVSTDGKHWTVVSEPYSLYDAENYEENNPTLAGPFDLGGTYQYVRFRSYSSRRHNSNNNWFNLGGLKVYKDVTLDPACQASTMNADVVAELAAALGAATYEAKDNTWANYSDMEAAAARLEAARLAFLAEFADPSALNAILKTAYNFAQKIYFAEDQIGAYSTAAQGAYDDIMNAIEKGEELLHEGSFTKVQLDQVTELINNAIKAFNFDFHRPKADAWYQIKFGSEQEWIDLEWDVLEPRNLATRNDDMVDSEENTEPVWNLYDRVVAVQMGYDTESNDFGYHEMPVMEVANLHAADDTKLVDPELGWFRFIPVGEGGAYALQNKATGLFVGTLPHGGSCAPVGIIPTLFTLNPVGNGFVTLRNNDFEGNYLNNALHFQRDSYAVTGWSDDAAGTKSALHIVEVASADEEDISLLVEGNEEMPMAYVLPAGVKAAGDAYTSIYTVAGKFQERLTVADAAGNEMEVAATFVGMKSAESVPAGEPFVTFGLEYASLVTGDTISPAPKVMEDGFTGTYVAYTAQDGELTLNTLNSTYYDADIDVEMASEWSVVSWNMPAELSRTIAAGGAYLSSLAALPTIERSEADAAVLVVAYDDSASPYVDVEEDRTSIRNIADDYTVVGGVYDLNGCRVADTVGELRGLKKGVYIVGGKKFLVL